MEKNGDSKISSPPNLEPLVPDRTEIHLPRLTLSRWEAAALLLCGAFAILAVTVAYKDQIWLDSLIYAGPGRDRDNWFMLNKPGELQIVLLSRLMFGWALLGTVTGVVLASGFFSGRGSTALQLLMGPIPLMKITRKQSLVCGEILVGVLLALWACRPILHLVQRHGPLFGSLSFPSLVALTAVAFWGTLSVMSWKAQWYRPLAIGLGVVFVASVLYAVFAALYVGTAWPTDVFGGLLLGGALLCAARSCIDRFVRA